MFYVDHEFNYKPMPDNAFSESEVEIINDLLDKNAEELLVMKNIANEEWLLQSEKSE